MGKAAEAFRTISEVADELGVQKHVLRFWEQRFPQVKPMKRGGGRRYYRPEDLELLRGIRHLLHAEGYTIKGVQKILRETGIDAVKAAGRRARAATTAGRKSERRAAATAPAADGATPAQPITVPADVAAAPRSRREILAAVIIELEACRRLLRGEPEPVADKRANKRTRAPRQSRA
ncbi:MAG: MerR family transcriptional regulator [Pseudomonadota bacterium]